MTQQKITLYGISGPLPLFFGVGMLLMLYISFNEFVLGNMPNGIGIFVLAGLSGLFLWAYIFHSKIELDDKTLIVETFDLPKSKKTIVNVEDIMQVSIGDFHHLKESAPTDKTVEALKQSLDQGMTGAAMATGVIRGAAEGLVSGVIFAGGNMVGFRLAVQFAPFIWILRKDDKPLVAFLAKPFTRGGLRKLLQLLKDRGIPVEVQQTFGFKGITPS